MTHPGIAAADPTSEPSADASEVESPARGGPDSKTELGVVSPRGSTPSAGAGSVEAWSGSDDSSDPDQAIDSNESAGSTGSTETTNEPAPGVVVRSSGGAVTSGALDQATDTPQTGLGQATSQASSRIFTGVLAAALAPFVVPLPGSPVEPPTLWAALAWVRRQFDRSTLDQRSKFIAYPRRTEKVDADAAVDAPGGTVDRVARVTGRVTGRVHVGAVPFSVAASNGRTIDVRAPSSPRRPSSQTPSRSATGSPTVWPSSETGSTSSTAPTTPRATASSRSSTRRARCRSGRSRSAACRSRWRPAEDRCTSAMPTTAPRRSSTS